MTNRNRDRLLCLGKKGKLISRLGSNGEMGKVERGRHTSSKVGDGSVYM